MLLFNENYWPDVSGNLRKARKKKGRFSYTMVWEEANANMSGIFYVSGKSVFIFGSDTWELTTHILKE